MNQPASANTFVPMQALSPTPELYDALTGDGMENLAKATIAQMPPISEGAVIHDNGCGTGAATSAILSSLSDSSDHVSISGTDINENALEIYRKRAVEREWPAEAICMDSEQLAFPADTFTHSIGSALLFVLPNDGIAAMKEVYRTLKPGGTVSVNCWAHTPNIHPIQAASKATRPAGTPLPRQGVEMWSSPDFLRDVVEKGDFDKEKIQVVQSDVFVTTVEIRRFATMAWSFIGGTSTVGWLPSDEEYWEKAIDIVVEELQKTDGFKELDGDRCQLKFVANIVVATK